MQQRPKHLVRKRINCLLSAILSYPLVIVEAPSGYGKTTAVKDFLAKQEGDALWIPFQRLRDVRDVWACFANKLAKCDPAAGGKLAELGFPDNGAAQKRALSILGGLKLARPTYAVFDNCELAEGPGFFDFLLRIGDAEIQHLHLTVITRDTTEINFTPLLSRGKCHIVLQKEMSFTEDEVRGYCSLMGSRVDNNAIGELTAYTGGWISLIYLLLLGLENGIPIGLNSTVDDLIEKTLFLVHGSEARRFLLRLSVMESFTEKQAAYVTEYADSAGLLRELRKKNAFLQYDEREKIYRIHPVLLDFLRARADFSEEETRGLFRRLGEWLLRENDLRPAYACLAKAGDAARILAHLNRAAPIRALYADFEGADELFATAPRELLVENPVATLRYLFYSLVSEKKEVAADVPHRLDELEAACRQNGELSRPERDRILGEILCVRKFTLFNDLAAMHAWNGEILRLLGGRPSSVMLRVNEFTFGSPHYLYIYFRDAGTLKTVAELSQGNLHEVIADGCGTGGDTLAWAEYACETGDYEKALTESRRAVYRAETKAQQSVMICARFCGARACMALGRTATARELLRELCDGAENDGDPVYYSMARLCEGYLYASAGQPEEIPSALRDGDFSSLSMFYGGLGFDRLVYAKVLLAQGEYLKLEALSDSFREAFSVYRNRLGLLHGAILLAAAHSRLYGADRALADLRRALGMAEPDGIVLPFAECAEHLLPVFRGMPGKERRGGFIARVFAACEQYAENRKDALPQRSELTGREKEVLALLAEGLSRKEIAQRLQISPATVKRHLEEIYRKLGANGKTAAVESARAGGLL